MAYHCGYLPSSLPALIRDALDGNPAARRVLDLLGLQIGRTLALLADLLDLQVIHIGGQAAFGDQLLLHSVREAIRQNAIGPAAHVELGQAQDEDANLKGAMLVLSAARRDGSFGPDGSCQHTIEVLG